MKYLGVAVLPYLGVAVLPHDVLDVVLVQQWVIAQHSRGFHYTMHCKINTKSGRWKAVLALTLQLR